MDLSTRATLSILQENSIDDKSALALQTKLVSEIQRTGARGVLIELSALDMVDSFMGRMLSDLASMCSTMNADTVEVGIQPSVAITLIELGLTLKGVHTALNVETGLELLEELEKGGSDETGDGA